MDYQSNFPPVEPRVTISLPCYGRPERTRRAIQCILDQDTNLWQAFIMGDGCPSFQKMIDSGELATLAHAVTLKGNSINFFNLPENKGGCGYYLTNLAIKHALGKYIVFFANDDVIKPNHLSNYLEIENTKNDYMYFDSYLDPNSTKRISKLAPSCIGHSEIILKTELAKKLKPHQPKYGHDWDFISEMISSGKGVKSTSSQTTYHVMHIPSFGTKDTID